MYLFTLFPQQTSGHAYIIKSSPAENEILTKPPKSISIQFSESIQSGFHSLVVMNSSGKQVPLKNDRIDAQNHSILETKITRRPSKWYIFYSVEGCFSRWSSSSRCNSLQYWKGSRAVKYLKG